jgi:secondary thiamine-phosphate synthase enzyme
MPSFRIRTGSRCELQDITAEVRRAVQESGAAEGVVTVFCPHTTAGITINENADPSVCSDLLRKLDALVPRGESFYTHGEGNSDGHVKSTLVGCSEQILLQNGELVLGTWQGIYFAEFDGPRSRTVHVGVAAPA